MASHGHLKDKKCYLESKASFIDISSIASFKLFSITWLQEYCTFWTVPWLTWSPRLGQNKPSRKLFSKKNHVLLSNFFSSSNMIFIRLFLTNTWKQNRGSPCSFKRKGEFIPFSSLVWGKSLTFCTRTRPCACADDAKIVRSRDAQCNTKELPWGNSLAWNCSTIKLFLKRGVINIHYMNIKNNAIKKWGHRACDLKIFNQRISRKINSHPQI